MKSAVIINDSVVHDFQPDPKLNEQNSEALCKSCGNFNENERNFIVITSKYEGFLAEREKVVIHRGVNYP